MQIKLSTIRQGFQIVATLFADLEELFEGERSSSSTTTATIPPVETPVSKTSP